MTRRTWVAVVILAIVALGVAYWLVSVRSKDEIPTTTVAVQPGASWNLATAAQPYRGQTIRLIGEDYPPLQAVEKIKSDFENTTGIKVEVERYEAEAVLQKINFDLNARTGRYDLIVQVYFDMGRLATNKQVRPLTDFVRNPALHNPAFDPDRDLFPVWKTMGWYRGTPYGYPMMVLTMYTWYRKDLFENPAEQQAFQHRYGYRLAPPETWEQYRDIAEFFTRPKEGLYGTLIQGKKHMALWQEYLNFLYSYGGTIMETTDPSQYGPIAINSPQAVQATEFYKSLLRYSPPDALNFTWDDALALMQQKKVAMCVMWNDATYALEDPKQSKVAGKMGYALLPRGPAGQLHQIGGQSYYVPITSQHPEAAYLFIEWLLTPENQVRQQRLGGSSPRPSTYRDPTVMALPWTKASLGALGHVHPAMLYTVPESLQIGEVIKTHISDALASRKPVKRALDDAALELKRILGDKATLKYPPQP
jgi:multiple sugar transport system substrate-binding protein